MKTYIKPYIDEIVVETINPIATSIDWGNEPGDSQGEPGRKRVYIEDDYEDEDSGW